MAGPRMLFARVLTMVTMSSALLHSGHGTGAQARGPQFFGHGVYFERLLPLFPAARYEVHAAQLGPKSLRTPRRPRDGRGAAARRICSSALSGSHDEPLTT